MSTLGGCPAPPTRQHASSSSWAVPIGVGSSLASPSYAVGLAHRGSNALERPQLVTQSLGPAFGIAPCGLGVVTCLPFGHCRQLGLELLQVCHSVQVHHGLGHGDVIGVIGFHE